jgi:hypothetical protein
MISLIEHFGNDKILEMKDGSVITKVQGGSKGRKRGECGYNRAAQKASILTVVVNAQTYKCDNLHRTKHKYIQHRSETGEPE